MKLGVIERLNTVFLGMQVNKPKVVFISGLLSLIVSTYAYSFRDEGFQWWDIVNGLTLSFADMPDEHDEWIVVGKILWMITLTLAIVFVALKNLLYEQSIKSIAESSNREHIVVFGNSLDLTQEMGFELALSMTEEHLEDLKQMDNLLGNLSDLNNSSKNKPKQYTIVVSDTKITEAFKVEFSNNGIYFIDSDSNTPGIFERAGIKTCKYVIVSDESDSANIAIAENIIKHVKAHNLKDFPIYTDIEDYATMSVATKELNILPFNNSLSAARKMFQKISLTTGVNTIDKNEQVHLLIIGFGSSGSSVAIEAMKLGHFYNKKPLKITIIDGSQGDFDAFEKYYNPQELIDRKYLELEFKCMDTESIEFNNYILGDLGITYIAICLDTDNRAQLVLNDLLVNLNQKKGQINNKTPIAVRMKKDIDLRCIYKEMNVFKFEFPTIDDIVNGVLNDKAKALHEQWDPDNNRPWKGLAYHEKDKNFAPADHEIIKADVIEYLLQKHGEGKIKDLVSLSARKDRHYQYKELSIERQNMIDMEHRRWNAYHLINGWKEGSGLKDKNELSKLHPCITKTQDLEKLTKAIDYEQFDYYVEDIRSWKLALTKCLETRSTQKQGWPVEIKDDVRGEYYKGKYDKNDKYHGLGVLTLANHDRYEGEFLHGKYHGKGVLGRVNGDRYEGEFKNGKYHGRGILTGADGDFYEGSWENGKPTPKRLIG